MKKWIVQRYDGPTVGWFTVSPEFKTRDEANLFCGRNMKISEALYAVSLGPMPVAPKGDQ